jgi:superfamily II DNA or RNA helicase
MSWWRAFLESDDIAKRRQIIAGAAKARFAKAPKGAERKYSKMETDVLEIAWAVCRVENPIDAILEVDSRVEEYARRVGLELCPRDPELETFLASDEPKKVRSDFEKKLTEEKLLHWLSTEEETVEGERVFLDVVLGAKKKLGEIPRLSMTLLLTSDRAEKIPLTLEDVAALDEDVKSNIRQLRQVEKRLVAWLLGRGALREFSVDSDRAELTVKEPAEILVELAAESLLVWKDGARAECAPDSAKLGLLRNGDAAPLWAVRFPGNEEAISLGEAELLSAAPQIFAKKANKLYRVDTFDMPLELLSLLARSPELPIEKLRASPAGAALVKRIMPGEKELTHTVPVRPVVELRLENEMNFSVSLWARASDGTELVCTHAGAWTTKNKKETPSFDPLMPVYEGEATLADAQNGAPIALSPHAITIVPREEDVAEAKRWVRELIPRHASAVFTETNVPAFTWKADPASTLRTVRHWIQKPKGIVYLGDSSFRKLVRVQDAPKVNVSVERTAIDWLAISVDMEEELATLSLSEIADALEQSEDDILMVHGARLYHREQLENFKRQIEALHQAGLSLKAGKRMLHVLELAGDAGRALAELGGARAIEQATDAARARLGNFTGIPTAPVAPSAAAFLRSYQRTGVDFLTFAARTFGGALLADDMGLGKTLQTLSAITALRALHEGPMLPCLVICPASVAHNWRREATKFCPELKVVVVEGPNRKTTLAQLGDYDLVIENFALIRRDVDVLKETEFLAIAVDEAQSIKNPGADTTKCVKQLRAKYRIALTGTPIENRLTDLWSIVDFFAPGYLGSLSSFERHAKDEDASVLHKMLRARLKPVLLRRLKRDVAPELPERIEQRIDCEMTDGQKMAYLAEVKRTRMLMTGVDDPAEWTGPRRIQMLAALTRLRQICCDPALCDLPDRGSGKLEELSNLLPDLLEAGHKVLLFSQFVSMLELLEKRLNELKIPYRMLTGSTPDRMAVVDAFEKDEKPTVFLISLKAGGTGLNLTSASHVILYDPWWSPALEAQAIDRAHRIGQKKTVVATRMVTRGTLEERILELQERKRSLQRGVLEDGALDTALTPDDFEFLLRDDDLLDLRRQHVTGENAHRDPADAHPVHSAR